MSVSAMDLAGFLWWDDAVQHAVWRGQREGRKFRVRFSRQTGRWAVRPVRAGGGPVTAGAVRLEAECEACRVVTTIYAPSREEAADVLDAAGWLRNDHRDQDICPDCVIPKVGLNVPGMLL